MKTTTTERLRQARLRTGLSARALSLRAGLSHSLVAMIESGRRENMGADTAAKLARELGISVAWLIRGDGHASHAATATLQPTLPGSEVNTSAVPAVPASVTRSRQRSVARRRALRPSVHARLGTLLVRLCEERQVAPAAIAQRWGVETSYVQDVIAGTRPWTVEDLDRLPSDIFDGLTLMWRAWRGLDHQDAPFFLPPFWGQVAREVGACAQASDQGRWDEVAVHAALLRKEATRLEVFARTQSYTATAVPTEPA